MVSTAWMDPEVVRKRANVARNSSECPARASWEKSPGQAIRCSECDGVNRGYDACSGTSHYAGIAVC